MELEKLKLKVEKAIKLLFKNDLFLLEIGVHERSVAHKLAEYLQQEFLEYHVDCEYNKDKNLKKELEGISECRGTKDLVFPDIIIHHRNTDNNLLVIEIKTSNNPIKCDLKKLELFTDSSGKFKYQFGLFLKISNNYDNTIESFVWYDKNREERE